MRLLHDFVHVISEVLSASLVLLMTAYEVDRSLCSRRGIATAKQLRHKSPVCAASSLSGHKQMPLHSFVIQFAVQYLRRTLTIPALQRASKAVQGFAAPWYPHNSIIALHRNAREEAVEVRWERRPAVHDGGDADDARSSSCTHQRPQLMRQRERPQHVDLQWHTSCDVTG